MDGPIDQLNDQQLLQRYVRHGDERAFTELSERHINTIYAAARRQVRDSLLAEDVTQAVLMVLVRRAASLQREGSLAGWLLKVTWFTARGVLRAEGRRIRHEQRVQTMTQNSEHDSKTNAGEAWHEIGPVIDGAMARLSDADRSAVALRFLEDRKLSEVARTLGITEAAATKRVSRGLARLQRLLAKRGIAVPTVVLSGALATSAAEAAPPDFSTSAIQTAMGSKGAVASSTAGILVKGTLVAMTMTKIKVAAAIGVVCLLAIMSAVVAVHMTMGRTGADSPEPVVATQASPEFAGSEPSDFMKVYGLENGQVMKRIINPPAGIRDAYMEKYYHHPVGSFFIGWQNNKRASSENWNPTYRLIDLATLTGSRPLSEAEVEGDPELLQKNLSGDVVFNTDSTDDEYCAALATLLHDEFAMNVSVTFQRVRRNVIVLRGEWNFQPPPDAPSTDGFETARAPTIELYATDPLDLNRCCSTGNNSRWGFARILGSYLHQQVILDKTTIGIPSSINDRVYATTPDEIRNNREAFLQHLREQTGLTWSEENRMVRRLFIEPKQ